MKAPKIFNDQIAKNRGVQGVVYPPLEAMETKEFQLKFEY